MKIVKANQLDIDEILHIYGRARVEMIKSGNPDQWVNGYPSRDVIEKDISSNNLYVCVSNDKIVACFAFSEGDDPTYSIIYEGNWLNNEPYSVIHRLAVLEHGKGIGAACIDWCLTKYGNIKVDTHEDNKSMQALLNKCGFHYCGVIKNSWGDPRVAFQKKY